ncbi:unnamed protein product [Caenorhabditis angaria]|uniref:Neurotransmitter-gated ion-channel ligand-binding domain-containing protein n=1 Tax=Caenorhabditis angaria TaxID=860376 RepID=A0A9P1IYW0_9PELO|nr:unnamed protein product [Caenorhabditis angaria]
MYILFGWILMVIARILEAKEKPEQYRIYEKIIENYKSGVIPKQKSAIMVNFSMELYQIIEVNEPQQSIRINAWVSEKWLDGMLGWEAKEYSNVSQLILPHSKIWIPDTTLYNSLEMSESNIERDLHVQLTTGGKNYGSNIKLLYPKIFISSCLLNLRYFPFDIQTCTLTFGSWSFDNTLIDYNGVDIEKAIGVSNCLENDGWNLLKTIGRRHVRKYDCCPNNYTLLEFDFVLARKPLYYIVNLIFPTGIITFISILGFFTSSSINDLRQEKISLGITTLLSMSILVFMVSDQMPSTSSFVPLIGWFYTSMIALISLGTLCASIVIFIQKQGILGNSPSQKYLKITRTFASTVYMEMPLVMKQAYWKKEKDEKMRRGSPGQRRKSLWQKAYGLGLKSLKINQEQDSPQNGIHRTSPSKPHSVPILANLDEFDDPMTCSTLTEDMCYKPIEVNVTPCYTRNLAQLEWDWIAAVVERVCLLVFIILFMLCSLGINFIGYYHWKLAKMSDLHPLV